MQKAITDFIVKELRSGKPVSGIEPDDSLVESGILDSLGLVRLISFLDKQFGVVVRDEEVNPENFQSIQAIENYVNRKRTNA